MPRLSVCADVQKVDRSKLAQAEFSIIEFDSDTFRLLLDYLHTGSCPLTCNNIPGLICAAEHYDLPELLQACFHHAKQFLRIEVVISLVLTLQLMPRPLRHLAVNFANNIETGSLSNNFNNM